MVNLNDLFIQFDSNISLSSSRKGDLMRGRDALRNKIASNFIEQKMQRPKFCGQGSYSMKTTIKSLPGSEYDLDDGVYLQGYDGQQMSQWPTTNQVHSWVKNAVTNHTASDTVDKYTCVRVIYAGDYHIDLPIYIMNNNIAYLAHKNQGWTESDPKAFSNWFLSEIKRSDEQVRRMVKYLKAWKDYKGIDLNGISITVLIAENAYAYDARDELALLGTVTNIVNNLKSSFSCYKPVNPYENLLANYDSNAAQRVVESLVSLKNNIEKANNMSNEMAASDLLKNCFGDRFPTGSDDKPTSEASEYGYIRTKAPGVLNNDGHSA